VKNLKRKMSRISNIAGMVFVPLARVEGIQVQGLACYVEVLD
jgi:hypothetical protein